MQFVKCDASCINLIVYPSGPSVIPNSGSRCGLGLRPQGQGMEMAGGGSCVQPTTGTVAMVTPLTICSP